MKFGTDQLIVELEITSHCNAQCSFCPRDRYDRYGHMTLDTYRQVIERILSYKHKPRIHFCGIGGDAAVHPKLLDLVRMAHVHNIETHLVSNGSLVNRERSAALIDAGIKSVAFSAAKIGAEYEEFYKLPFEKLVANVKDFILVSESAVDLIINLPKTKDYEGNFDKEKSFWRNLGVKKFLVLQYSNHVTYFNNADTLEYKAIREAAGNFFSINNLEGLCFIALKLFTIAWNGDYLICDRDHTRTSILGNVFHNSFEEIHREKIKYLQRAQNICANCNAYHDAIKGLMQRNDESEIDQFRQIVAVMREL